MPPVRPPVVGGRRGARGVVVAGACLCATSVLHTAAGGRLPLLGLVLAGGVALALGTALAQHRRRLLSVVGAVLGCQTLMHLLLSFTGMHGGHGDGLVPSVPMVGAHVGAAVVTAIVLYRADEIVVRWAAFWRTLRTRIPVPGPILVADSVAVVPVASAAVTTVPVDAVRRRGPPTH